MVPQFFIKKLNNKTKRKTSEDILKLPMNNLKNKIRAKFATTDNIISSGHESDMSRDKGGTGEEECP